MGSTADRASVLTAKAMSGRLESAMYLAIPSAVWNALDMELSVFSWGIGGIDQLHHYTLMVMVCSPTYWWSRGGIGWHVVGICKCLPRYS